MTAMSSKRAGSGSMVMRPGSLVVMPEGMQLLRRLADAVQFAGVLVVEHEHRLAAHQGPHQAEDFACQLGVRSIVLDEPAELVDQVEGPLAPLPGAGFAILALLPLLALP